MRDHVHPHPRPASAPSPVLDPQTPDGIQPLTRYTLAELRALDLSQPEPAPTPTSTSAAESEPESEPIRRVVVDTSSWSAHWLGEIELRAQLEALDFADAEITERFAGREEGIDVEYARYVVAQQREMVANELRLRASLARQVERAGRATGGTRSDPGHADERARRYAAWVDLARQVRQIADVIPILGGLGLQPRRTGTSGRRGTPEYHSPCPVCGGRDRLISWPAPNSRCVCRQCGISMDPIALVRYAVPGRESFFQALGYLAAALGLPQPDDPYPSSGSAGTRSGGLPAPGTPPPHTGDRHDAGAPSQARRADGRFPIATLLPAEAVRA